MWISFFVLSFQLHVCKFWQDAGNALDQPKGSWEREKLGTHLITGPHQMLELFTHRAWNLVCGEMIYNFTLTAGGKQGERDSERLKKKGNTYLVFFLCQQIPEWFQDFDYVSFCCCNNLEGYEKMLVMRSTWLLVGLWGWRQWSLLMLCLHESTKSLLHIMESATLAGYLACIYHCMAGSSHQLYINLYFEKS